METKSPKLIVARIQSGVPASRWSQESEREPCQGLWSRPAIRIGRHSRALRTSPLSPLDKCQLNGAFEEAQLRGRWKPSAYQHCCWTLETGVGKGPHRNLLIRNMDNGHWTQVAGVNKGASERTLDGTRGQDIWITMWSLCGCKTVCRSLHLKMRESGQISG